MLAISHKIFKMLNCIHSFHILNHPTSQIVLSASFCRTENWGQETLSKDTELSMCGFCPKSRIAKHILLFTAGEKVHGALRIGAAAGASCQLQHLTHLHVASQPPGGETRSLLQQPLSRVPRRPKQMLWELQRPNLRSQTRHFCCISLVKTSYKANADSSGIEINSTSSWEDCQTHM